MNFKKLIVLQSLLIVSLFSLSLIAQESIDLKEVDSDPQREEVQRYFGYESLLYRYLTQPYDISINVNQGSDFVDIGYLYLMFIPILLLFLASSRKLLFSGIFITIISLWIISTSNSYIFSPTSKVKIDTSEKLSEYLSITDIANEPTSRMAANIYALSKQLYSPFEKMGKMLSGDKDRFTYPFLFIIFLGIGEILRRRLRSERLEVRLFLCFTYLYSFYWLLFGGGIIWYCYIMFPASMLMIFLLLDYVNKMNKLAGRYYSSLFYVAGAIWVIASIVFRLSSVQPQIEEKELGKGMFNPTFYDYGTGKLSKAEALDKVHPNLTSALARINSEDQSIVYKIGTSFNYYIKNNHKRVYQDHQLGTFYWLLRSYPDRNEIAEVLKASKVKYLIVDLHTAAIDYTPDKTLRTKFRSLKRYVNSNPTFRLIATDNVVGTTLANGQLQYSYNTIGKTYYGGRYAIYEII